MTELLWRFLTAATKTENKIEEDGFFCMFARKIQQNGDTEAAQMDCLMFKNTSSGPAWPPFSSFFDLA